MPQQFWLFKSEPCEYSIYQLEAKGRGRLDGVRNVQSRNYLLDMKDGDITYFYHASCSAPGIYGRLRIIGSAYSDPTAFDPKSHHFDKKGDPSNPRWLSIDVQFLNRFKSPVLLSHLKQLKDFGSSPLTSKGNRLTVIPLTEDQSRLIENQSTLKLSLSINSAGNVLPNSSSKLDSSAKEEQFA